MFTLIKKMLLTVIIAAVTVSANAQEATDSGVDTFLLLFLTVSVVLVVCLIAIWKLNKHSKEKYNYGFLSIKTLSLATVGVGGMLTGAILYSLEVIPLFSMAAFGIGVIVHIGLTITLINKTNLIFGLLVQLLLVVTVIFAFILWCIIQWLRNNGMLKRRYST